MENEAQTWNREYDKSAYFSVTPSSWILFSLVLQRCYILNFIQRILCKHFYMLNPTKFHLETYLCYPTNAHKDKHSIS